MPGTTTDTVPTMLTPGEFVIKRESAKMLGKPFLEKLNAVSDNSAHDNIDALITQAALAQMQPMMGGGVVNEYMGGGDVSNYMGGGDVMKYMYGGGVKNKKKKKMAGYQDGGAVSDNTATSAMDALIAQSEISQALKENPQSNYSMVDADIVDAENRELIEMIMNMAMPGSGVVGSVKKVTGKLPELAKKFASMSPDKGKQKVLDKIGKEMNIAPTSTQLNKKPFDAMDLINEGYLQKYTNKLIKNMKPSGDVKLKDIVDSKYYNINEATKDVLGLPKKERMKAAKDLLKSFNINLKNVKGKQDGGAVGNSFIPLDQRDSSSVATGKWGEFGDYNEHLKQLINLIELDSLLRSGEVESIERKPESDNFLYNDFNNPRMSPADSSNVRNLLEFFNSQLMQGRDSSDIQRGIN